MSTTTNSKLWNYIINRCSSQKPVNLSTASKYSAMNGLIYLALGVLFIVWPGVTQAFSWIEPS